MKLVRLMSWQISASTEEQLAQLTDQSAQGFQEDTGTLRHVKTHITIEDKPKFHKTWSVPYSVYPRVKAEPKRLEDQAMLLQGDWSDWTTPIEPEVKRNGTSRICGSFKVPINPVLHDHHPLPHMDDTFTSLTGRRCCLKTDWAQAHLQVEVEVSSRSISGHGLFPCSSLVVGVTLGSLETP